MATNSWYYNVAPGKALPYPDEEGAELEALYLQFASGQGNKKVQLTSGRYEYEVDFEQMLQTNLQTQRTRSIERRQNAQLAELAEELRQLRQRISAAEEAQLREKRARKDAQKQVEAQRQALQAAASENATLGRRLEQRERETEAAKREAQAAKQALQPLQAAASEEASLRRLLQQQKHETKVARQEAQAAKRAQRDAASLVASLQQQLLAVASRPEGQTRKVWQFKNHLEVWQPYDVASGQRLMAAYREWIQDGMPDCTFELSDRYSISFRESWQQNSRSGGKRAIRLADVDDSTGEEHDVTELIAGLERQLEATKATLSESQAQVSSLQEELSKERSKASQERNTAPKLAVGCMVRLPGLLKSPQLNGKLGTLERFDVDLDCWHLTVNGWEHYTVRPQYLEFAALPCVQQELSQSRQEVALALGRQQELDQKELELKGLQELAEKKLEEAEHQVDKARADTEAAIEARAKEVAAAEEVAKQKAARELSVLESAKEEASREIADLKAAAQVAKQTAARELADLKAAAQALKQARQEQEAAAKEMADELAALEEQAVNKRAEIAELAVHVERYEDMADKFDEKEDALRKTGEQLDARQRQLDNKAQQLQQREAKAAGAEVQMERFRQMVRNTLVSQGAAALQRQWLLSMPDRDDATLRSTGSSAMSLMDDWSREMLRATASFRELAERDLRADVSYLLTDLSEHRDYVPSAEVLDRGSPDFAFVEAFFQGSLARHRLAYRSEERCPAPLLEVQSISLVGFPPKLLNMYIKQRDRISKRSIAEVAAPMVNALRPAITGKDVNEHFLFHGCPWTVVEKIEEGGFHWRHRGENTGAMFGQGIYFADRASKCDFYSEKRDDGTKCMFLARVMLGSSVPRWRSCADVKTVGETFDSICGVAGEHGGSVDFPEAVIFQKAQALPVFKIVYRHMSACRCNLCCREGA